MKKILAVLAALTLLLAVPGSAQIAPDLSWIHGSTPAAVTVPLLVSGTAFPTAQTPAMPSVSTWGPSCDPTGLGNWGAGCNTSTHLCIAPTSGTPYEPCQPPKMLVVTGSSYAAGNATILYTSYAHYVFPTSPSQPLLIENATQTNWNTPIAGVTSFATTTGPNTITLGIQPRDCGTSCASPFPSPPFIVGQTIYVGGTTGSNIGSVAPGQGWGGYTCSSCATGATAATRIYPNVPITSSSGAGTGGSVNLVVNGTGTVTAVQPNQIGTGYVNGDVITGVDTTAYSGINGLSALSAVVINSGPTSPNGAWTVTNATASSVTFNTGAQQVTGTLSGLNTLGYNGTVQEPWVVSASVCNIGGVPEHCSVTFPNPNSCSSSCVSASTQIVAAQNDNLVMAWHYGEDMQYSVQSGDVLVTAIPKHLSPIVFASASLNNGPWNTITTGAVVNPWGLGKSGLTEPATPYSYVWHFAASSVPDGENEIRVVACATDGNCEILSSVRAIDGAPGSNYFTAVNHGLQSMKLVGIQNSFDPSFPNYNWGAYNYNTLNNVSGQTISSGTAAGLGTSTDAFTVNFTANNIYPTLPVGSLVNIAGLTTNMSCTIASGTATGTAETLLLSGTCNFPVGAEVNIAGTTAAWAGVQLPVTGQTGGATTTSITVASTVTNGSTVGAGGTVTANWNGHCIVSASSSGSITCPQPFNTATAMASAGTLGLTIKGNLFCVIGGAGDQATPNKPAGIVTVGQYNPNAILLQPAFPSNCSEAANATGCSVNPCGSTPSQQETFWITTKDAGSDERRPIGNAEPAENINGSLFITTNFNQTIQATNVHVDSWQQTAGGAGCGLTASQAAGTVPLPFTGTYCTDTKSATNSLLPAANGVTQALTNASSCLTFTAATNSTAPVWYAGEPVVFLGSNTNSSPTIGNFTQAWIKSAVGTAVTISATPTGTCINDTAANIYGGTTPNTGTASEAILYKDIGMDSLLLACDTTNTASQKPCTTSNPQTVLNQVTGPTAGVFFGKSGWFTWAPDTASGSTFPATHNNVSLLNGASGGFNTNVSEGGHWRVQASTFQAPLALTSQVAVTQTPPISTPASGSLGSCTVNTFVHQCETLNFNAVLDFEHNANGAKFQAPTSGGSPGQGITIIGTGTQCPVLTGTGNGTSTTITYSGSCTWSAGNNITVIGALLGIISPGNLNLTTHTVTASSVGSVTFGSTLNGTINTNTGTVQGLWDCGSNTVACTGNVDASNNPISGIVSSTTTSVTFINDPATGSLSYLLQASVLAQGASGTAGTYTGVALVNFTNGTVGPGGSGGQATIVVASGHVTSVTITTPGSGYQYGDIFTVASASIGNTVNFQGQISGPKIVPDNIIIEFPPNTFAYNASTNPNGLCAVSNVSIDTGSTAKACLISYSAPASTATGTNSTAFPFQFIPGLLTSSLVGNSNCLPIFSGQGLPEQSPTFPLASPVVTTMPVTPGVGGKNDIMALGWGSVAAQQFSFQAFNNCGTGPFYFGNAPFTTATIATGGATDAWSDGRDVIGPNFHQNVSFAGDLLQGLTGAEFVTNSLHQNVNIGFDNASYASGSALVNAGGVCANALHVGVNVSCTGIGEHGVPNTDAGTGQYGSPIIAALGGSNYTGLVGGDYTQPVLGGLDVNGNPTLCSGAPCLNSSTVTLQVAQGTLSPTLTQGWQSNVYCNYSWPTLNYLTTTSASGIQVGTYNNSTNPSTLTAFNGTNYGGSQCLISQNPEVVEDNSIHVDNFFWSSNTDAFGGGFAWIYVDHSLYENVENSGSVRAQGIFTSGFQYSDQAFDDIQVYVMNLPLSLTIQALDYSGGNSYNNWLVRDSNIWGVIGHDSPGTATSMNDLFHVNDYGGTWVGFPNIAQTNMLFGGYDGLTTAAGSPQTGAVAKSGSYQNITIWPTLNRGTDTNGNPLTPGAPSSTSLSTCPWTGGSQGCLHGDGGLGTM